jgi:hypothetical protein
MQRYYILSLSSRVEIFTANANSGGAPRVVGKITNYWPKKSSRGLEEENPLSFRKFANRDQDYSELKFYGKTVWRLSK